MKQRRGGEADREHAGASRGPAPDVAEEVLEALAVGNQAAAQLGGAALEPEVRGLAERAATALRVVPRDPAWTARMVSLIAASRLPEDRRALIGLRLDGDQRVADQISGAVERHVGGDTPELRSALIAALDGAAGRAADASGAASSWLAGEVAAATGVSAEGAQALVEALSVLVVFGWDEDEEELAPPGDYAAEESGF